MKKNDEIQYIGETYDISEEGKEKLVGMVFYSKESDIFQSIDVSNTFASEISNKCASKEELINSYIEKIGLYLLLSNAEIKVLAYAIKNLNYANVFFFSNNFTSYFLDNGILSRASVYKSINSLVKKNILMEVTDEVRRKYELYGNNIYSIKAEIIGKNGAFIDLKEIKRFVVQTFDFKNLKIDEKISITAEYNEFSKPLPLPVNEEVIIPAKKGDCNSGLKKNDVDKNKLNEANKDREELNKVREENVKLKFQLTLLEEENAQLYKKIEQLKLKNGGSNNG